MTVATPSVFGDEILVDGIPVGNLFQFAWNVVGKTEIYATEIERDMLIYDPLLISASITQIPYFYLSPPIVAVSFQFLGVLLTYLLHNSHASKVEKNEKKGKACQLNDTYSLIFLPNR